MTEGDHLRQAKQLYETISEVAMPNNCNRECDVPKVGLFARAGKMWMCPNCSRVYVLDIEYAGAGDSYLRWRFAGFLVPKR